MEIKVPIRFPTETAASTAEMGPLTLFKERQLTSEEFLVNQ